MCVYCSLAKGCLLPRTVQLYLVARSADDIMEAPLGSPSMSTPGSPVGDYWNHMDRVSSFAKNKDSHHKLTPAQQARMEAYESLDFELCENELFREFSKQESKSVANNRRWMVWVIFMMIGVCTGTSAFLSAGKPSPDGDATWSRHHG